MKMIILSRFLIRENEEGKVDPVHQRVDAVPLQLGQGRVLPAITLVNAIIFSIAPVIIAIVFNNIAIIVVIWSATFVTIFAIIFSNIVVIFFIIHIIAINVIHQRPGDKALSLPVDAAKVVRQVLGVQQGHLHVDLGDDVDDDASHLVLGGELQHLRIHLWLAAEKASHPHLIRFSQALLPLSVQWYFLKFS